MKSEKDYNRIFELISRAKTGDTVAFNDLYKECYTPVYRYIFIRVGGSRADAEDITQDAFVKIFRNLSRFKDMGKSPLAYFFTVARTTLIDRLRKRREQNFSDLSEESLDAPGNQEDAGEAIHRGIIMEEVSRVMKELSENECEAISLRFFGERSTKEIASLMGKSEDAVRQLQSRGLRMLGKKLSHHE